LTLLCLESCVLLCLVRIKAQASESTRASRPKRNRAPRGRKSRLSPQHEVSPSGAGGIRSLALRSALVRPRSWAALVLTTERANVLQDGVGVFRPRCPLARNALTKGAWALREGSWAVCTWHVAATVPFATCHSESRAGPPSPLAPDVKYCCGQALGRRRARLDPRPRTPRRSLLAERLVTCRVHQVVQLARV